jgi:hypothetical protein
MHQINIYLLILIMYNYLHPITNGKIEVKFVQELDMDLTPVLNDPYLSRVLLPYTDSMNYI